MGAFNTKLRPATMTILLIILMAAILTLVSYSAVTYGQAPPNKDQQILELKVVALQEQGEKLKAQFQINQLQLKEATEALQAFVKSEQAAVDEAATEDDKKKKKK